MFLSKNGGIYFPDDTAEAETSKNVYFAAASWHKKSKRGKHPRLPLFL